MKESPVSKEMVPLWSAPALIALFLIILAIIAASRPFRQSSVSVLAGNDAEIILIDVEKEISRGEVWLKKVSAPSQIDAVVKKLETAYYKIDKPVPEDAIGGDLLTITIRYHDESEQVMKIQPRANGMIYTTPGHETGTSYVGEWAEADTFWDSVASPAEKINFKVSLLPEEDKNVAAIWIYSEDP